jgi:hypothetical protein
MRYVFKNKHSYTDNVKLSLCASDIPGGAEVNIDAVLTLANRVLRRIFGPKRDEVTGEWRKLHN